MTELCKCCGRAAEYVPTAPEDKMAGHVMFGHMPDPALCVECLHRALLWAAQQALAAEKSPQDLPSVAGHNL